MFTTSITVKYIIYISLPSVLLMKIKITYLCTRISNYKKFSFHILCKFTSNNNDADFSAHEISMRIVFLKQSILLTKPCVLNFFFSI